MNKTTLAVTADDAGTRIDAYVASNDTTVSRSAAARLCEDGSITVNGRAVKKNYALREGDEVEITLPEPVPDEAVPQDIALDIVYEDSDIIVINKPQGMVVHPAAGNLDGTLVNALLYHCGDSLSGIGGVSRPGIVHRIDKDTAGLLVVAKNDAAHISLSDQLKRHEVSRIYSAIVIGTMREDSGTVDAPLGRDAKDRKRMAVIRDAARRSREAVTHWQVLERYEGFTLVRCQLETGRTHQIRVHMAHIGHPLMGDTVYGGGRTKFEAVHKQLIHGQCLFAGELSLTHPRTGERMHFTAPMPLEFDALLQILRKREL
ncbi:MAG: RluA family pseudouridine synthase [Clostridia bacterium]|nr:RluA family pseudouridine synthase [Clostridia bacterium]